MIDLAINGTALRDALCQPFTSEDLEWKVQTCGKKSDRIWALVVPYLSARAIQSRLDDTVGPGAWRNRYEPIMKGGEVAGFLCYLSLRIDGEWVEKCDGAELTDIEPVKGGISNSLKRCAVQWGLGRYLYAMPTTWANVHPDGKERAKTKDNEWFNWDPPQMAAPPAPKAEAPQGKAPEQRPAAVPAPPAATPTTTAASPTTATNGTAAATTESDKDIAERCKQAYAELCELHASLAKAVWARFRKDGERAQRAEALQFCIRGIERATFALGSKKGWELLDDIIGKVLPKDLKSQPSDAAVDGLVAALVRIEQPEPAGART